MSVGTASKYLDYEGLGHFYDKIKDEQAKYGGGVPFGIITMWAGSKVPIGWALCDGKNGTPDLSSKFILGATTLSDIGAEGGSINTTVTIPKIGVIDDAQIDSLLGEVGINTVSADAPVAAASDVDETVVNTMPPYYTLAYIMKLASIDEDLGIIYYFRGSVASLEVLKSEHGSGNKVGDVYNILSTGESYGWDGGEWISLGSGFYRDFDPISTSDILALFE